LDEAMHVKVLSFNSGLLFLWAMQVFLQGWLNRVEKLKTASGIA
jgi:hypothetical protein